jgi:hypothetical protein
MNDFPDREWITSCRKAEAAVRAALSGINRRMESINPIDSLEEYECLRKSRASLLRASDALKIFRENKP